MFPNLHKHFDEKIGHSKHLVGDYNRIALVKNYPARPKAGDNRIALLESYTSIISHGSSLRRI